MKMEKTAAGLPAAVKTRKTKRKGGCEGACAGVGTARKVVKGKCPKDCDDEILGKLRKEAKKKAKEKADKDCEARAKDCECSGKFDILEEGCEDQKVEECGDVCIYYVTALYAGGCKKTG